MLKLRTQGLLGNVRNHKFLNASLSRLCHFSASVVFSLNIGVEGNDWVNLG